MSKLSQKHLLGIKDITRDDIELIFETADNFKEIINRPIKKVPSLRDVTIANVLLHVGAGTFRPVDVEDPAEHAMHEEWYEISEAGASSINEANRHGARLWAVGTTVARTLESAAGADGVVRAGSGWTRLFIRPGFQFRAVDALITNFHLPRSTLIMLVSAFAGYQLTRAAYEEAIRQRYRFYSYGDAMVIL